MTNHFSRVVVCRLLGSVLPLRHRDVILGDLVEEYALRVETASGGSAARWLCGQACRSVVPMIWSSLRSWECLFSVSIALAIYVAMGTLNLVADLLVARLTGREGTIYIALVPVLFLATSALGGYTAGRIRSGTSIFLALLVVIEVIVAMYLRLCTVPVPWWYPLPFLVLGPVAVLLSPALADEQRSASR